MNFIEFEGQLLQLEEIPVFRYLLQELIKKAEEVDKEIIKKDQPDREYLCGQKVGLLQYQSLITSVRTRANEERSRLAKDNK